MAGADRIAIAEKEFMELPEESAEQELGLVEGPLGHLTNTELDSIYFSAAAWEDSFISRWQEREPNIYGDPPRMNGTLPVPEAVEDEPPAALLLPESSYQASLDLQGV